MPARSVTSVNRSVAAPAAPDGEIVAEQPARSLALRQERVEVAVAVVVEERRAGAHDLVHVVLALGPVDVRERDGGRGVLEEWRRLNPQGDQGDQERYGRESVEFTSAAHFSAASSRSIAAARSLWPNCSASRLRFQRPLDALVFAARAQVRDAQGEEVSRRFGVSRFHDLLELGGGFVRASRARSACAPG